MNVTIDDKLVWDLGSGSKLFATKELVMEHSGERAFTAGMSYTVESMHPIAEPAYVVLKNDQGLPHRLEGSHIREFFRR